MHGSNKFQNSSQFISAGEILDCMLKKELKPVDRSVLLALYDFYAQYEGIITPSHATLAKKANCSKPTLIKSLKKLEELNIIVIDKRSKYTSKEVSKNETNQYFLTVKDSNLLPTKEENVIAPKRFFSQKAEDKSKLYPVKNFNYPGYLLVKKLNCLNPILTVAKLGEEYLLVKFFNTISIYNTFYTLYTNDTNKQYINKKSKKSRLEESEKAEEEENVKQKTLFGGELRKINKKYLKDEQLFQYAHAGEIKLNHTEFIKVFKHLHRTRMQVVPGGKFTQQEVADTLQVLREYKIPEEIFWDVIIDTMLNVKNNTDAPYLALRMLREAKDVKNCLEDAIHKNTVGKLYSQDKNTADTQEVEDDYDESEHIF